MKAVSVSFIIGLFSIFLSFCGGGADSGGSSISDCEHSATKASVDEIVDASNQIITQAVGAGIALDEGARLYLAMLEGLKEQVHTGRVSNTVKTKIQLASKGLERAIALSHSTLPGAFTVTGSAGAYTIGGSVNGFGGGILTAAGTGSYVNPNYSATTNFTFANYLPASNFIMNGAATVILGGKNGNYTLTIIANKSVGGACSTSLNYNVSVSVLHSSLISFSGSINGFPDSYYAGKVADPAPSLVSGSYPVAQSLSLSCATPGAGIKYTVDGSDPKISGTAANYVGPININTTMTVKAYGELVGKDDSNVITLNYTIGTQVADPAFSLAGGTYSGAQSVNLSSVTPGATIKYTTDGSDPTTSPTAQIGTSVIVATSQTVKAYALKAPLTDSNIVTVSYTITNPPVATPTFSVPAGTYDTPQTVIISTTTFGATIKYTTDGTDPVVSGTAVTGASVNVTAGMAIRAYAFKAGLTDSVTVDSIYVIRVADPTPDIAAGTYDTAQNVTFSTTTAGASIKYTVDGTDPIVSGTAITGTNVNITVPTVVKVYAFKAGINDSNVITLNYNITAAAPTPDIAAGTYVSIQNMTLSSTTAGATIKYTTDGTDPTVSGTAVTGTAVTVDATMDVKAYAFKAGLSDSPVVTYSYTINLPPVADPVFTKQPGNATLQVQMDSATVGASITYTTDNTDPKISGTAITVANGYTVTLAAGGGPLKAFASKAAMADSAIVSESFYQEIEANNTAGTATLMSLNRWYYNTMVPVNTDYLETGLTHTFVWKVELTGYPAGEVFDIVLEDSVGAVVTTFQLGNGTDVFVLDLNTYGFTAGTYRFKIDHNSGANGDYDFKVSIN